MIIDSILNGIKKVLIWIIELLPEMDLTAPADSFSFLIEFKRVLNYMVGNLTANFFIGAILVLIISIPTISLFKLIIKLIRG